MGIWASAMMMMMMMMMMGAKEQRILSDGHGQRDKVGSSIVTPPVKAHQA